MSAPPHSSSRDNAETGNHPRHDSPGTSQAPLRQFGTLSGVFVPTLLTILGVLLFLREGWIVGHAGLLGSWLIILLCFAITTCTALAMSSAVTNIRIEAGGAYSIVARSLGLEVAGSLALPLCVSQALAVAMYVFGFREGWQWMFPNHPALAIDLITLGSIVVIALISTKIAIRVQYLILLVLMGSLVSVAIAAFSGSMDQPITWWGDFDSPREGGQSFWVIFAVFFPASTGILAGLNMSGELRTPRRSIPLGTMAAIGVSLVVYLAVAYWLARSASPKALKSNYTIMIDLAFWSPAVVAGLLAATYSSALVSFIGAPRILEALGRHQVIPGHAWIAKRTRGEPLNATIITTVIAFAALMTRELNLVAPLITLFFLLTYAAINLIVLIEQSIGLVSFRPLFSIPRLIPAVGLLGSLAAMFIIRPVLSLIAMVAIGATYFFLLQRSLNAPFGDMRRGIVMALAEWAARRVKTMEQHVERVWAPNLLIPTDSAAAIEEIQPWIVGLAQHGGSVKMLGIAKDPEQAEKLQSRLCATKHTYYVAGIFATSTSVQARNFVDGVVAGIDIFSASLFAPNIVLLRVSNDTSVPEELVSVAAKARQRRVGVGFLFTEPAPLRPPNTAVNLWLSSGTHGWRLEDQPPNLNLSVLLAYCLSESLGGQLNLIATVTESSERPLAQAFTEELQRAARVPSHATVHVADGECGRYSGDAPEAGLNIFPLGERVDMDLMASLARSTSSACLFVQDGGGESAFG